MAKDTKYKPGRSGNPKTQFQPGNPYRWQPGQSGNPAGVARIRVEFEEALYRSLLEQGSPEEVSSLLWECARKHEPWAILALLQRAAPQTHQLKVTHDNEPQIDYSRLTDSEIADLEKLFERARTPVAAPESGEGEAEL